MENKIKNHGVILGVRGSDYVAGTLPYEVRNPSGDWIPYLPVGEVQKGRDDWMDCVSRSYTNSIEIQERFLTGQESNYSDRLLAKRSETTKQGNYLYKVADIGRNEGLVSQKSWPDTGGDWDEQYADIPQAKLDQLLEEGKSWFNKWDVKNEDVPVAKKSLQHHLKHAPIQIILPGHSVVEILNNDSIEKFFDSYEPFLKNRTQQVLFAKKIVLYKKEQSLDTDMLLVNLEYGNSGKQVLRLKRALTRLGWITGIGDIYDDDLTKVVWNYQLANLSRFSWGWWWVVWYRGKKVEYYTRENINNNLKYRK